MNVVPRRPQFAPVPGVRRLFLVGCPRSGTTLLQSLVAAHSQLTSFPESHFFSNVVPQVRWRRLTGMASERARDRLITFLNEAGEHDLTNRVPLRLGSIRACTRLFVELLDHITRERRKIGWLEKTPTHLSFTRYIEALVPGSLVIHLVRNGADTIASLYHATQHYPHGWGGARDLDACINRWLADVERSRAKLGRPGHVFIRYEGLFRATDTTLRRLCSDLGLPFEPRMLVDYPEAARQLQLPSEQWKRATTEPIGANQRHKFKELLTREQQQRVLERIAHFDIDRWFPADVGEPTSAVRAPRGGAT